MRERPENTIELHDHADEIYVVIPTQPAATSEEPLVDCVQAGCDCITR